MVICGYCYEVEVTLCCGQCKKRHYCSKECQKNDWKYGGHKFWCIDSSKSDTKSPGELGVDFEIRDSDGKGLGLFALRDFEINDKVIVE